MPALTVRLRDENESAEARALRLQLPRIDPRNYVSQLERHGSRWQGREGFASNPDVRAIFGSFPLSVGRQQGFEMDAYEKIRFRESLVSFLHILRCIVDGSSSYLSVDFKPEDLHLPGEATNNYQCPWWSRRNPNGGSIGMSQACEGCGASAWERCVTRTTQPRRGREWWSRYEAEFSGTWPAWWQSGGMACSEDGSDGFPAETVCVAKRKLLQLKVLLARMVLNRGDTLAIRCLVMSAGQGYIPSHSRPLDFVGVVYFSHCFRCRQPYGTSVCQPPELERRWCESSNSWYTDEEMRRHARDNHLRPYGEQQLRHDAQPGYPMHYYVQSDTFHAKLLGRAITMGDFCRNSRATHPEDDTGELYSTGIYVKEQRVYDPSPTNAMFVRWQPLQPHLNQSEAGCRRESRERAATKAVCDAAEGSVLPVVPAGISYVPERRCKSFASGDHQIQRLPDVHVDNPSGSLDVFYRGCHIPVDDIPVPLGPAGCRRSSEKLPAGVRPNPTPPVLRPEVDRLEELMQWAEECAMSKHGIALPYMEEGFAPDAVGPPFASQSEQPGPSQ